MGLNTHNGSFWDKLTDVKQTGLNGIELVKDTFPWYSSFN